MVSTAVKSERFDSAVRRVGMPKMGGYYEHHGDTVGFARAKDVLEAEGGKAALKAPQSREEKSEEMAVGSKQETSRGTVCLERVKSRKISGWHVERPLQRSKVKSGSSLLSQSWVFSISPSCFLVPAGDRGQTTNVGMCEAPLGGRYHH